MFAIRVNEFVVAAVDMRASGGNYGVYALSFV
jgi:hypothetical protein